MLICPVMSPTSMKPCFPPLQTSWQPTEPPPLKVACPQSEVAGDATRTGAGMVTGTGGGGVVSSGAGLSAPFSHFKQAASGLSRSKGKSLSSGPEVRLQFFPEHWHTGCWQSPDLNPSVPSSGLLPASPTHCLPSHLLHQPHSPAAPAPLGAAPQCHPALTTPIPGLERRTEPSSDTVPHPIVTNSARSWSYENISISAPGLYASVFGNVSAAGGSNFVPVG